jgi:hypothetical protein
MHKHLIIFICSWGILSIALFIIPGFEMRGLPGNGITRNKSSTPSLGLLQTNCHSRIIVGGLWWLYGITGIGALCSGVILLKRRIYKTIPIDTGNQATVFHPSNLQGQMSYYMR